MARQHGYFILIPAFIPVDKNSLQNQIAAGQVLNEAAQTRDLAAIMGLEGIRYHAQKDRAGSVKDMHVRWGSREVEAAPGGEEAPAEPTEETAEEDTSGELYDTTPDEPISDSADPEPDAEPATHGRRSRAKAA